MKKRKMKRLTRAEVVASYRQLKQRLNRELKKQCARVTTRVVLRHMRRVLGERP